MNLLRLLWELVVFAACWLVPVKCLWCGQWWPLIGGPPSRQSGHCKRCGRGV